MITLEGILFVVFLVAGITCVVVSTRLKIKARELVEKEGGTVPWSMRASLPIDVRQLRGPAVVPAVKSNKWGILAGAVGIAYFCGLLVVKVPPFAFSLMTGLVILTLIGCMIYAYRISIPQEPDDGAKPQASP
jgi:hypothetical protein